MDLPHLVEIGDAVFYPQHMPDMPVCSVVIGVEGWYQVAGLRGSPDTRPHGHGTFTRTAWWRDAPAVSVKVAIYGEDPALVEAERIRLFNQLWNAEFMRVHDHTGVWERRISVEHVKQDSGFDYGTLSFVVDVETYDPARYSANPVEKVLKLNLDQDGLILPKAFTWSFGSTPNVYALIKNSGTVPAYPEVTISGGTAQVALVSDVTANRVLAARITGQPVLFDCRSRQMFRGGVDQTSTAVRREWFMIPPGQTHRFDFIAEGATPGLQAAISFKEGVL